MTTSQLKCCCSGAEVEVDGIGKLPKRKAQLRSRREVDPENFRPRLTGCQDSRAEYTRRQIQTGNEHYRDVSQELALRAAVCSCGLNVEGLASYA